MLTTLIIKDFAIIDALEISFDDGMSVLTGETGAGKSIIIDALNLLLGGRATTDVIRAGKDKAVVEGSFELDGAWGANARQRLDALDIGHDDELVVRRVVSRSGRNPVLLNGSLATLGTLRDLMKGAIDISGQHEHQSLMDTSEHIRLLDRFSETSDLSRQLAKEFHELSEKRTDLDSLREAAKERSRRLDYLRYQLDELSSAELRVGEEDEILEELRTLQSAEELQTLSQSGVSRLYEDDGSICERLDSLLHELHRAEDRSSVVKAVAAQLADARAIIDDATHELRALNDFNAEPQRLEELESRLSTLNKLRRKYNSSVDEIIAQQVEMAEELSLLEGADSRISELAAEIVAIESKMLSAAVTLSERRKSRAKALEGLIEAELADLGMAACRFHTEIQTAEAEPAKLTPRGLDRVEFLLQANQGEALKPLAKVASGGELSRLMLAMKRVLTSSDEVATFVFDEVDAGIGGAVAARVAKALAKVAASNQVLCITHLATIASYADHHFSVSKHAQAGRTVSAIRKLDDTERIGEIARMLGGLSITETTLEHAAEMVERARLRVE